MKTSWKLNDTQAIAELHPETLADRAILDALGAVQTAVVKKNGTLQFIMEVPNQPLPRPIQERPKDEVRDSTNV